MYVAAGSDIHPLYPGAPLSKEASWLSIHHYAISNRLTDAAMKELIELIKVHIPSSDLCPTSLYSLKKCFGNMNAVTTLHFCSNCQQEVEKKWPRNACKKKKVELCYFSILPFEYHLAKFFSGTVI